MIVPLVVAIIALTHCVVNAHQNVSLNINPDTVDTLSVPAYLGLWYQMAADQIVYSTFEKDSYCATAQYGDNGDGTLSVHNYATIGAPDGDVYVIDGYAYQTKPEEEPGQLKVVFESDDAAPFPAPYWILELGPINADGLYDYAIVSDSLSAFLFVLARDVETFNTQYKDSVYATLTDLGFTGKSAPIDTYHGSDCVYESTSRKQQMQRVSNQPAKTPKGASHNATAYSIPETVDELNINSYLGLWFQMSADQLVYDTIEPDAYCVTAQYGDNGDGTISVHNYQTTGAPDSGVDTIDGYAYQKDAEEAPGKLNVVFPSEGEFPAPYWVLELGPLNEDGLYDYSIVSDPFTAYLFVLARDVETFNIKYKESVSASLEKLGFTGKSAPIDTYQGSDCVYESTSRKQQMQKPDTTSVSKAAVSVNPDTVDTLDVPAYLGLWYQMASDAIVFATFEKDAYCATAQYGDNGDGTLSVHNYATIGAPDGDVYVIDGYAYQTRPEEEPGQLKVVFDSDDASPIPAPYWILELGPINADGLYDYAIVSDSISSTLFVLARDVATYNAKYKESVSATLTELGFTGKSAPIDLYQDSDCVYESTSRKQQMQK